MKGFSVHTHFYQPPREDPLTGEIPKEHGADPYKNFNEKIHNECYRPNADLGNFKGISFNLGPTLDTWIAANDPLTLERIVEADRENVAKHGVGNAMAQSFNHTILPLASYHDKITQVKWGIASFENRFGRRPQGMWLPEAAVDKETLEVLADNHIGFVILAPWQAAHNVDVTHPYLVEAGNRSINVFFYHAELSGRTSFDREMTTNADVYAKHRLAPVFHGEKPQFVVIASDGELYGHHQELRQYFLARLYNGASDNTGLTPSFPALWLKNHPATQIAEIKEKSSWSCPPHGVERWNSGCSCTPGDSSWKYSLRKGLDSVGDMLNEVYEDYLRSNFPGTDPLELRNDYVRVILGKASASEFTREQIGAVDANVETLLKSQDYRQKMFTSCGWFFEDFDRIEPANNIRYCSQAVVLASGATGTDLVPAARQYLEQVVSPRTGLRATEVFDRHIHNYLQRKQLSY
jgi:alpha-amylase/alpha-mannosidase (GH57 family)